MTRFRILAIGFVLAALCAPAAARADNPPGLSLTIGGPAAHDPLTPVTFGGQLSLASAVGVPLQEVRLVVDGAPAGATTSEIDGTWQAAHVFPATPPYVHTVEAVAFAGTPLETRSLVLQTTTLVPTALVINEVDYDQPGSDVSEFVEIYNPSSSALSLDGCVLVFMNGASSTEYGARVVLSGTLPPGGFAVVAQPTVPTPPEALRFSFAEPQDQVQNGAPDALGLFYLPGGTLIDALSYEGSVVAGIVNGVGTFSFVEGTPTAVSDNNTTPGSLARLPNGADTNNAASDWAFTPTPTPGSENV